MIPANFNYYRAKSIDEALALLADHGDDAKLLAGGHSLIPAMKLRLNQPGTLIDIGRITDLRYIEENNGYIAIGAGSTHHDIARSELLKDRLSMFPEAADMIGDVQVRNMGTLGGSLVHADPAADWPALILASGSRLVLKSAQGERKVDAADFFTGFYMTALKNNEILTEIQIPNPPDGSRSAYRKFMQPASRFAIVGCAALTSFDGNKCKNFRLAFTGVSDMVFRDEKIEEAMEGKNLSDDHIEAAADRAAEEISVLSDHFASEEYRKHLAKVYAKRAISALSS